MSAKKPKKHRYSVSATVIGSKHIGFFEAESEEEALRMAEEKNGGVSLCHSCERECEGAEIEELTAERIDA